MNVSDMSESVAAPPFLPFLFPLLNEFPTEIRQRLVQGGIERHVKADTVICTEGAKSEHILFLSSGILSITANEDLGKRAFLYGYMPAGSIAGLQMLFNERVNTYCLTSAVDSHYLLIGIDDLLQALREYPLAWQACAKELATGVKFLLNFVNLLSHASGYQKLRTFLGWLERNAQASPNQVGLDLSQQEIAARIGLSREMVNRMLAELKKGGYIEQDERGRFHILKPLPKKF
ncbi:helix-turn-helix domain-containing protein [Deefgea sp. CFH1-16]|nr:helix-turn-helix domain-containing protein [Deefgea sp. CFH1-16]